MPRNPVPAFIILGAVAAAATAFPGPARAGETASVPAPAGNDSTGAWTAVPLPDGTLFYLRYGPPGGVVVRSGPDTSATAPPPAQAAPAPARASAAPDSLVAIIRRILREELAGRSSPAVSRPLAGPGVPQLPPETPAPVPPRTTVVVPGPGAPAPPGETAREPLAGAPESGPAGVTASADSARGGPGQAPARLIPPPILPVIPPAPDTVRVPGPSPARVRELFLNQGLLRTNLVLFETGRSTLLDYSKPSLDAVAEVMREFPDLRIRVEGHTDSRGSAAFNLELSRARAAAVRDYLVNTGGIAPDRVEAEGFGEERPLVPEHTPTDRALNRRVEFRVLNPEALERTLEER